MWFLLGYFLLLIITVAALLVIYARWHYGELEKLGIPVVKPHFLLGSSPNSHKIVNQLEDCEWLKKYGDVFGVYTGRVPQIFVSDPDMVRRICIKDFDKFANHQLYINFGPELSEMLDFIHDEKWKVTRSLVSPFYTSAKLKRMSVIMKEALQRYVDRTEKELNESATGTLEDVPFYLELFATMTDLISRCTLSIHLKDPKDPNNEITKALRELMNPQISPRVSQLMGTFPFLKYIFGEVINQESAKFIPKLFKQVMNSRKVTQTRQDDLVDIVNDIIDKIDTDEYRRLGITVSTIICQGATFFFAGHEAMATVITELAYHLSKNPEIEEKLLNEIDSAVKKNNGDINREIFGELVYLTACLNEILRLYPSFTRLDRLCSADWEYKGLRVRKGMAVVIPIFAYNRNPKYFPNPDEFDPERFMPYNKDKLDPITFGTFGFGPRSCIGMRFAMEGMIITAAHIFRHFRVVPTTKTELKLNPGSLLFVSTNVHEIGFDVQKRHV
jgi:cytochrome P450 family 3 subfamily A